MKAVNNLADATTSSIRRVITSHPHFDNNWDQLIFSTHIPNEYPANRIIGQAICTVNHGMRSPA